MNATGAGFLTGAFVLAVAGFVGMAGAGFLAGVVAVAGPMAAIGAIGAFLGMISNADPLAKFSGGLLMAGLIGLIPSIS